MEYGTGVNGLTVISDHLHKKEISILECAQSNDKETTDTKDANELDLDEIIEIVVSS